MFFPEFFRRRCGRFFARFAILFAAEMAVAAELTCERTREQTLDLVVEKAGGNEFLGRHTNPNEDLRTGKVAVAFGVADGKVTNMQDLSEGTPIEFERLD